MIEERLGTLAHYLGVPRLAEASAIKNRRRWQIAATDLNIKNRIDDMEEHSSQYEL